MTLKFAQYILEGHEPKEADLMTWAKWFEHADRQVARDEIGDTLVSTVFIGLGIGFEPVLFETCIFKGDETVERYRCKTWDEALEQHAHALGSLAT